MRPKSTVGVAIPTYNRENYLRILLNSIPKNIFVTVSDNGGFTSDKFKEEYSDCNFVATEQVTNYVQNWNNAVNNLDTTWVCVASDDDIFYENAFELFDTYLLKFPDAEIIVFGHNNIDELGKKISSWSCNSIQILNPPLGYNLFQFGVDARVIGVFFKKELYNKIGKFDEFYKITAADSDFIQLALLNGVAVFVPEITVGYRIWQKSLTGQLNATKEWMNEIIYWQTKIASKLEINNFKNSEISTNTNEVIARNLVSGLNSLHKQKKGFIKSLDFIRQVKYPIHATIKTQLAIIKCLLKASLKI